MEIIIKCEQCNTVLDGELGKNDDMYVVQCPTCEKRIKDEAYEEGYDKCYRVEIGQDGNTSKKENKND